MYDMITVGGATVDNFLDTNVHEHKIKNIQEICYPLGAKLMINNVDVYTGGGGTNTAVAFSRMGMKTGYIGNVGKDYNGKIILDELKKENVKFLGTISRDQTDFSVILDSRGKDRTILNYKDASANLKFNKINKNLKTKWFYFTSVFGDALVTLRRLAKYAGKHNIDVGFNASTYLAKQGLKNIGEILKATTVFVLNKEEAIYLVGIGGIPSLLKRLHKAGPKIVCITDGRNGSFTYDGEYVYYQKPHLGIKVIEKTGAGDAYAATFIAGIAGKKSIQFSLNMALANAESVITCKGAKNNLKSWRKLCGMVDRHKPGVSKTRLK